MNIEKYKVADCTSGGVLREADKSRPNREWQKNVDQQRIADNYSFLCGSADTAQEKLNKAIELHNQSGKKIRSDAVLFEGIVITLPPKYKGKITAEQEKDFFRKAEVLTLLHFGIDKSNVLMDCVHKDETSPHLHLYVMPILDNRFNAKNVITKAKVQTYHQTIEKCLMKSLDWYKGGILTPEIEKIAEKQDLSVDELKHIDLNKWKKAHELKVLSKEVKKTQDELTEAQGELYQAKETTREYNTEIQYKEKEAETLRNELQDLKKDKEEWQKVEPDYKRLKAQYDNLSKLDILKAEENRRKALIAEQYLMPTVKEVCGQEAYNAVIDKTNEKIARHIKPEYQTTYFEKFQDMLTKAKQAFINLFKPKEKTPEPVREKKKEKDFGFSR